MNLVLALAGLVVLLLAGDTLVRAAVALSRRIGVPSLIVGLTVVAFGTSAPELLITIQAAIEGVPGIAIGNVVGSNIANILLVLGVPALIAAIHPSASDVRRSYVQMLGASFLMVVLCFLGPLQLWHAAVLLTLFALMLLDMVRSARNGTADVLDELESVTGPMPGWQVAAGLVLGIVGLPLGAQLLIDGAVGISRTWGISEEVIGLTMVAVGTSLPELATTVMAALRREADVALGNVIGSNLFNILSILGVASLFGPIAIDAAFLHRDLWVMLGCALLLLPFIYRGWAIGRAWGAGYIGAYGLYTWSLF